MAEAGESDIRAFLSRYERFANDALQGAAAAGAANGRKDETFLTAMASGHARSRALGARKMTIRHARIKPMGKGHWLAGVDWRAVYARPDAGPAGDGPIVMEFEIHYLIRFQDGQPQVFGWISGDEDAQLRAHGLLEPAVRH